jgi:hypothetical protein
MPVYYKSDTIINGTTYNRLFTRGICHAVNTSTPPPTGCPFTFNYLNPEKLFLTIRQDTMSNIVYVRDMGTDVILYDFNNIHVGQDYPKTYNNQSLDTLVVVSEDSMLIGNTYAKKWDLGIKSNGIISDSGFVSIIEGVGSTFGIAAALVVPFENNEGLLCFSKDGTVLYPDSTYDCDKTIDVKEINIEDCLFSFYPNPTTEFLNIKINSKSPIKGFVRIFNMNGMEVHRSYIKENETQIDVSLLNNGVYFIQFINRNKLMSKLFIKE